MIENNYLFAALLVQPLLILVLVMQGYRLSKYLGSSTTTFHAIEANSVSLTLGLIMPMRTGELIKPLYLRYKNNTTFSYAAGAVLLERIFDLFFFVCVAFSAIISIGINDEHRYLFLFSILLFIIIIFIICYLCIGHKIIFFLNNLGFKSISQLLESNLKGIKLALNYAFSLSILSAGLLAWALTFCVYAIFFYYALPIHCSFMLISTLFIVGTVGMGLAITPGSLGTYESALGVVLLHQGLLLKQTFWMLVCFRIALILPTSCISIFVFLRNRLLITEIKQKIRLRHKDAM